MLPNNPPIEGGLPASDLLPEYLANPQEGDTQKKDKLTIQEILSADNVAEILSDDTLTDISKQVTDDYNKDQSSCSDKMEELKNIVNLAKMISEEKDYPWDGASNVIYPLIANASIEFGATLYPAIIKDSEVVKAKIIGNDEGKPAVNAKGPMIDPQTKQPIMANVGQKMKRGKRVATYMNYQLLDEMPYWETDVDKLGNASPTLGNLYKKVYWDPVQNVPVSELIFPDKIIINNGARDIRSSIVTHILELYPQEIMQRIRSGVFVDYDYDYDLDKNNQEDPQDIDNLKNLEEGREYANNTKLHLFLEQHTWLDLDDDGFPEPYIITLHLEKNKIVRIVPRFREEGIEYNHKQQIKNIKTKHYFVKYGFIPSPDGSFFDIGFGHLLFNLNNSVNSTLNQLFDAGHLSITGGGFLGKGLQRKGGRIALSPGEWIMVDSVGTNLKDNIVPIPQPQPNPTLFALLGYLVEAGKGMSMLKDVLSGEAMGNVQATTYISMVEQGLKQFKAIYKRFYKSLKEELKLLYELNAEHLSNEKYAEVLDESLIEVDVRSDFSLKGYDICPVADIEAVTSYQRMAQANFLMQFLNNPYVDQMELLKYIFEVSKFDNIGKLVVAPPPPPPNPMLEVERLKTSAQMQKLQVEMQQYQQDHAIKIQKAIADLEKMKAEIEKIHTSAMVDLSNVAKIGADIKDSDKERQIKIMDNLIDQETKKIEVEGKIIADKLKLTGEAMKIHHQSKVMQHEHNMMDKELAKVNAEVNPNE